MSENNLQWVMRRYVAADEIPSAEHFELISSPQPQPGPGEVLLKVLVLGTSPAQRMYVTKDSQFHIKVEPGEVMSGRGIAVVVASRHPDYQEGEVMEGTLGWQQYVALSPDPQRRDGAHVTPVSRVEQPLRPLSTLLGIFGQRAFSAYVGMIEIGQTREGDAALVSAAAGGVGSIACQLARIRGASRVVGMAGGEDKCRWLVKQGLCDAAINYREGNLPEQIRDHFPAGVDVFLDNVGGDTLDAVLENLAVGARIAICGHISTEYQNPRPPGPTHYYNLLYRRSRMEGFFVFDYLSRWPEFERQLRDWYQEGRLISTDDVLTGIERMPDALTSLFTGAHKGCCVVQVADDPSDLPQLKGNP
ncbi:MAG: NADP-dependent oxidoreductase [Pseudomonadota bacterium]